MIIIRTENYIKKNYQTICIYGDKFKVCLYQEEKIYLKVQVYCIIYC
jgi:hypothetical protein